ncbi:hypothetical protein V2H45_16765 [Tumidithrix elongata RA019]|uniref:Uncharacterized protein n=1 Tax=Tumidithrix elongata BACA0141 TaxID=2716417 RepID=A0AAW9Q582_9CYAN|nr:hypothetical protein [Tumidithrix elongata RA019]
MRFSDFTVCFLLGAVFLYFTFAATTIVPYAHHDQIRYFREDFGNPELKNNCYRDVQYQHLYSIGRPITAELECMTFRNVHTLSDLNLLRIGVILLLAIALALLSLWLISLGISRPVALFLSAAVFTLPGAQNTVFMTNFANAVAPLLAIASSLVMSTSVVDSAPRRGLANPIKLLLSLLLILTSFFTYPFLSFFYLVPSIGNLLFNRQQPWRELRAAFIRDVIFLGVAALIYFVIVRLWIVPFHQVPYSTAYRVEISIDEYIFQMKLNRLFDQIVFTSFNFWNIYTIRNLSLAIVGSIIAVLLATIVSPQKFTSTIAHQIVQRRFVGERAFALCTALLLPNFPWLLSNATAMRYRLLFPTTAIALLIFAWSLSYWLTLISKKLAIDENSLLSITMAGLMIGGGLLANYNTVQNVWNSNVEVMFIRGALVSHLDRPIHRIHVIKPPNNWLGYNGLPTIGDEFNRKSLDFSYHTAELVRVALLGIANAPTNLAIVPCESNQKQCATDTTMQGRIVVTHSILGEPIYDSKNMVIINMGELVLVGGNRL